jgi:hypothetical protein
VRASRAIRALRWGALATAALLISLTGPGAHPSAAAKDAPRTAEAIAGASAQERLDKATALEKENVDELVKAFAALGDRKVKRGDDVSPDLELLSEYVVSQRSRALRTMALDAGARLDQEAFAAQIRAKADGEDRLRSALAAEALGMVGGKEDVPRLLELARSPSISIAVRACRAVARIGSKRDAEALMEIALDHEDPEVGDHAAWAAQDILKTQKAMLGKMKKLVGKDAGAPRALRYSSLEAMLADHLEPFKWKASLEPARELLLEAATEITINCRDPKRRKRVEDTLAWIKENLPGSHLLVRAAIIGIDVPATPPDAHIDITKHTVGIPLSYTVQTPKQLAYHVVRAATVIYEKRIGHPFRAHRGWENAVFDSYDVCALAGLYNAGKGGINRDQFLVEILSKRPWGGN